MQHNYYPRFLDKVKGKQCSKQYWSNLPTIYYFEIAIIKLKSTPIC